MKKFKGWLSVVSFALVSSSPSLAEHVMPETATPVVVSNRDNNRFVCSGGDINDVYFSDEKGVKATPDGRNLFIKFLGVSEGGTVRYVNQKVELFVVCASTVYTVIMDAKDVDAQTHYLGNGHLGNVQDNLDKYGALPEEQRALDLTLAVLKNEIPESFTVNRPSQFTRDYRVNVIPNAQVAPIQDVVMDGVGLTLSEFQVVAQQQILLEESQFLDIYFGKNIFTVSIEPRALAKGEAARVFVVQKETN